MLLTAVHKIVADKMDPALIKPFKLARVRVKKEKKAATEPTAEIQEPFVAEV
jgi:hypothetical protein